jgi:outer membrane protein assembly factor BamB
MIRATCALTVATFLAPLCYSAPVARYRIVINRFHVTNISEQTRELITARVRAALRRDSRVTVLESEDVADLLLDATIAQQAFGVFDQTTVPKPRLLAANYVLVGRLHGGPHRLSLVLKLIEIETRGTAGAAEVEWDLSGPSPDFRPEVAELLGFIPQATSTLPDGYATIEVDPSEAVVRFLNEDKPRSLPLKRLALRPGRYALAIMPTNEIFAPAFTEMRVEAGRESVVTVRLLRRRMTIPVPATSPSALFVDDGYVLPSQQAVEIEAGEHNVTIVSRDGDIRQTAIDVGRHASDTLTVTSAPGALQREAIRRLVSKVNTGSRVRYAALRDDSLAVVTDNAIITFDALTVAQRWTLKEDRLGRPVIAGNLLIVTRTWGKDVGSDAVVIDKRMEVLAIHIDDGTIVWRSREFADVSILDSAGDRVLILADGVLHLASANRAPKRISFNVGATVPPGFELYTGKLTSEGFVLTDASAGVIGAYYDSGKPAWRRDTDDRLSLLASDDDGIITYGVSGRLSRYRASNGHPLWSTPVSAPVKTVTFMGASAILLDERNDLSVANLVDGTVQPIPVPRVDVKIISAVVPIALHRLAVVYADHRVAMLDSMAGEILWHQDFDATVTYVGSRLGALSVVVSDGTIATFAISGRRRILGWIESVGSADVIIRSAVARWDAGPVEFRELRAYERGDVHDAVATLDIPRLDTQNGTVRIAVDTSVLRPGLMVLHAGRLFVDVSHDDTFVWVDGSFEGRGDRLVLGLALGPHEVVAVRPGYQSVHRSVHVGRRSETVDVAVSEEMIGTTLEIDGEPRGAAVYVDGTYAGTTLGGAAKWVQLRLGESAEIRVNKPGYRSHVARVTLTSRQQMFTYKLSPAPPRFRVFSGGYATYDPEALGWNETAITPAGVVGPARLSNPALFFVSADATYSRGRFAAFIVGRAAGSEVSFGAGARLVVGQVNVLGELSSAFSLHRVTGRQSSSAPSNGYDGVDRNAPLEEWSHPIRNVYVQNSNPFVAEGSVRLRPRVDTFLELSAGLLFRQTLAGTALRRDASGHLVRSPDRSYRFTAKNGYRVAVEGHTPIHDVIPFFRGRSRWSVYAKYELRRADYGVIHDQSSSLALGVGIVTFQSSPR